MVAGMLRPAGSRPGDAQDARPAGPRRLLPPADARGAPARGIRNAAAGPGGDRGHARRPRAARADALRRFFRDDRERPVVVRAGRAVVGRAGADLPRPTRPGHPVAVRAAAGHTRRRNRPARDRGAEDIRRGQRRPRRSHRIGARELAPRSPPAPLVRPCPFDVPTVGRRREGAGRGDDPVAE